MLFLAVVKLNNGKPVFGIVQKTLWAVTENGFEPHNPIGASPGSIFAQEKSLFFQKSPWEGVLF